MSQPEPRNPFYVLLLLSSFLFLLTALAVALVPVLEQKAAGQSPPSAFRDALRTEGWLWLLYEVAAMIVFGLCSMGLDRLRRLQKEHGSGTMPPGFREPISSERPRREGEGGPAERFIG